jgi:hypothetical protein
MQIIIIFTIGYAVGGASALLLLGLALAGRKDAAEHGPVELVAGDAERYGL